MQNIIKIIKIIIVIIAISFILVAQEINEKIIKNYFYYLKSVGSKVKIVDGIYKNDRIKVTVKHFDILKDNNQLSAVILLYEREKIRICELTSLVISNKNIYQTNSIVIDEGWNIVKGLKIYQESYGTVGLTKLNIISLEIYENREVKNKMFLLVWDEKMKSYQIRDFLQENIPVVRKPAIYLYPTKRTKITIKVKLNGKMLKSTPEYNEKWEVEADNMGNIYYKSRKYKYLFYENTLNDTPILEKEYLVISHKNLNLIKVWLKHLGLNSIESEDFYQYILEELSKPENKAAFYKISRVSNEFLEKNMRLDIDPKPRHLIRVILYFQPFDDPTTVDGFYEKLDKLPSGIALDLRSTIEDQKGFIVVEWGTIIDRKSINTKK